VDIETIAALAPLRELGQRKIPPPLERGGLLLRRTDRKVKLEDLQSELEAGKSATCPELRYEFITLYNGAYAAHMKSSIGPIWFPLVGFTKDEKDSKDWVILN
jgi:hypothetical protein